MNRAVQSVLDCPPDEQLEAALFLLRALTCDDEASLAHYKDRFGLSRKEGQLLHYLAVRAPRVCTPEQVMSAIYGIQDEQPEVSIVKVWVCKVRKRLEPHGVQINTSWGVGNWMAAEDAARVLPPIVQEEAPEWTPSAPDDAAPTNRHEDWTLRDTAALLARRYAGWEWWQLARHFRRTERACMDRYRLAKELLAA